MPNKRGARSIHTAARYGNIPIINTLIQRGEKVDVTTNVSVKSINDSKSNLIKDISVYFVLSNEEYVIELVWVVKVREPSKRRRFWVKICGIFN